MLLELIIWVIIILLLIKPAYKALLSIIDTFNKIGKRNSDKETNDDDYLDGYLEIDDEWDD